MSNFLFIFLLFFIIGLLAFLGCFIVLYFKKKDPKCSEKKYEKIKSDCESFLIAVVIMLVFNVLFFGCIYCTDDDYSHEKLDKGYTSDPSYSPTLDERGEYHNNGTGDRQIQYQGSREQRRDLDDIDQYMRSHPDF